MATIRMVGPAHRAGSFRHPAETAPNTDERIDSPAGNTDPEVELPFDTVAYGIGNWHLAGGEPVKAQAK